jgi:hypothetical protein
VGSSTQADWLEAGCRDDAKGRIAPLRSGRSGPGKRRIPSRLWAEESARR